jgi:hypothetical protein
MVANDSHMATGDFQATPLQCSRTEQTHTKTTITAPAVLITPAMIDQMRERRRQLQALKAWAASRQRSGKERCEAIADREGRSDGR